MPLVQSLDILRQRVANRTFKAVLDGVYDKVKAGTSLSDAFAAHSGLFPAGLRSVADGRRAQRQSRCRDPALRGVREGDWCRQASDHLGPHLPGDPRRHDDDADWDHRRSSDPGVFDVLRQLRPRAPSLDAHHRRRVERDRHQFLAYRDRRSERCRIGNLVGQPSWSP